MVQRQNKGSHRGRATRRLLDALSACKSGDDLNWCPRRLILHRASFHPLTNRKHHCRLCGKIICSLPVNRPQRLVKCSILFVVDPKTWAIEEVGEGVDYGVRKQASPNGKARGADKPADDAKFLKGVRICRDCRPVLLYVLFAFFSP